MKLKLFLIISIILIIIAAVYLSFDKIALYAVSKFYNLNISYKSLVKDPKNGYTFEDLKMINKKMGLGFFSSRATIKPLQKLNFLKSIDFDFKFKDSHFIKSEKYKAKAAYDTLEGIVAVPFDGRWTYKDISGTVEIFSNGFTLKKFSANSREIKLFLSGDIFYKGIVDVNITASFSKDVLKDVPPDLSSVIMNNEPEEWKSLSVKLKGDYRSPSVQIYGKLFRLNIGTMVTND